MSLTPQKNKSESRHRIFVFIFNARLGTGFKRSLFDLPYAHYQWIVYVDHLPHHVVR